MRLNREKGVYGRHSEETRLGCWLGMRYEQRCERRRLAGALTLRTTQPDNTASYNMNTAAALSQLHGERR